MTSLSLPDGLAEAASHNHFTALIRMFGIPRRPLARMMKAAGIKAKPFDQRNNEAARRGGYRKSAKHMGKGRQFSDTVIRDTSAEDMAADHLRNYAPVYRCDERGRMDPKGKLWRYGLAVLSGDEIIERAARHGFSVAAMPPAHVIRAAMGRGA